MEGLIEIYCNRGFICTVCDKPYDRPYTRSKDKVTHCFECWGGNTSSLWGDCVIADEMDEIAMIYRNPIDSQNPEDVQDLKNYKTMELVIHANWSAALVALATYSEYDRQKEIPWKGTSRQILVEACEHKECPKEIIDAIMRTGMFPHIPRKCLNPCGIGAMTAVNVCAERGSLDALKALVAHDACVDLYPLSLACIHGHPEVLDYLLTLPYSYNNGHGTTETTLLSQCSPSYMMHLTKENGHWDVIKPIFEKYFPKYLAAGERYEVEWTKGLEPTWESVLMADKEFCQGIRDAVAAEEANPTVARQA